MDLSLKDIISKLQDEEIPFLGDLMNCDELEPYAIEKKTIEVTSITFNEGKFHGEVVLNGDFSEAPDIYDHIIVGVRLIIKSDKEEVKKDVSAVWTVAGFSKVRQVEINQEVTPGPAFLCAFLLMTLEDFGTVQMIPVSLAYNCDSFQVIDNVREKAEKVKQNLEGVVGDNDERELSEFLQFLKELPRVVEKRIKNNVSHLTISNWIKATNYVVRKLLWAEKQAKNVDNIFLNNLGFKFNRQKELKRFADNYNLDYIVSEKSFREYISNFSEAYVLYMNFADWSDNQANVDLFLRFKNNFSVNFAVVNLDLALIKNVKPFVIAKYRNGELDVRNVTQDMYKSTRKSYAKCKGNRHNITPKDRSLLETNCPGYYTGSCPKTICQWLCIDCEGKLYYGFDGKLYCSCPASGAELKDFGFRCDKDAHGPNFTAFSNDSELKSLEKIQKMNIIVLGQSGVGKSTWINAFVNYMTFDSLEEARNSEFLVPIPVKFKMTNPGTFKQIEVVCGNHEDNENRNYGQSGTQDCKEYNIVFENKVYNLIDTPGLGDSRGIEEDKKNVKKILDQLQQVDVIHGICLILKPNESRITLLLKYCLKEILSNLHKSSSDNLLFCFTHARSTFYRAGESLPTLQALLREIKIDLPCADRSFYLDNEAFKFLCCQKANIKFTNEEEVTFTQSWDKSVEETKKLLDAVSMLSPHHTTETLSLNRSRNIILKLIPFMVEITESIERNMRQVEIHQKSVTNFSGSLNDLKNLRFVTHIEMEREPLTHPRTVCAAENCVQYEFLKQSKERTAIYKTHCHPHCYLPGKNPDVYPNPELKGCAAMNGSSTCIISCGCSWDVHMHIWYVQKLTEKMVKDADVERRINNYQDKAALKADLIASDRRRINELESEKNTVISNCVKFACFLKANAIVAYNDSFLDYLELSLRQLREINQKTQFDKEKIANMDKMKSVYIEEKRIFEEAAVARNVIINEREVARCERELYNLPIHGRQLKNIMELAVGNQSSAPRDATQATTVFAERPKKTTYQAMKEKVTNFFYPQSNGENHQHRIRGNWQGRGRGRGKNNRRGK